MPKGPPSFSNQYGHLTCHSPPANCHTVPLPRATCGTGSWLTAASPCIHPMAASPLIHTLHRPTCVVLALSSVAPLAAEMSHLAPPFRFPYPLLAFN